MFSAICSNPAVRPWMWEEIITDFQFQIIDNRYQDWIHGGFKIEVLLFSVVEYQGEGKLRQDSVSVHNGWFIGAEGALFSSCRDEMRGSD